MTATAFSINCMNDWGAGVLSDRARVQCRLKAIDDHLYSEINDEAIILSLKNGRYYGLNAVGVSIWRALRSPVTVDEIISAILDEYEIDADDCKTEITSFLQKMADEDLINFVNEKDS